jgi:hypothetical protein
VSDLDRRGLEPDFPVEFVVEGTPVSQQSGNPRAKDEWKERIRAASRLVLPEGHWVTYARVSVTIFHFPEVEMEGDLDNIVKLFLDAMSQHIYGDDVQVERIVVQKFEPGRIFQFALPPETLEHALRRQKPVTYVRVSTSPFEELE